MDHLGGKRFCITRSIANRRRRLRTHTLVNSSKRNSPRNSDRVIRHNPGYGIAPLIVGSETLDPNLLRGLLDHRPDRPVIQARAHLATLYVRA